MKQLSNDEMQAVSGAGLISLAAGMLGEGIGIVIDAAFGGKGSFATDLGRNIGKGIGVVLETSLNLFSSIMNIFRK
ncbi:hypothetical protein [Kosakonia radicincitans]|uniref:hypothetical protein n=1 Tax=Kosakonia radicincitans TaxID=283686 RepID=UPI0005C2B3ED|nr:hypothetical protein [Kosakonia radicincitans]KIS44350.1 hypothetical protein LG58_1723 [Kosakonia radicincitans YD4]